MKSSVKLLGVMFLLSSLFWGACTHEKTSANEFVGNANALLDSIFVYYQQGKVGLFNENYPKKDGDVVTYLADADTIRKDKVAYLWPTSGVFSAVNALLKATSDTSYAQLLDTCIIPGLHCYVDTTRLPVCYQSYLAEAGHSDRFYDDNIWLGIDYVESYELTKKSEYTNEAERIWNFLESGRDSILGDGIYWCEQKKHSKNTCSNAPASVLALKLYQITKDEAYLNAGKELYQWTKTHLQDSTDGLYFDNISLQGKVTKWKFQYNSGQMMQAAALLFKHTQDSLYLEDAQQLAKACDRFFFEDFVADDGTQFRALKNGNVWFVAIMLRGFEEVYAVDGDKRYLNQFIETLRYMWNHNTNVNKLFDDECFVVLPEKKKESKWLLTQAAMVEMYARLANYINK